MIFAPSLLWAARVYVLSRTSVGVVFNIVWIKYSKKYPSINPSKQVNLGYKLMSQFIWK